MYDVELAAAAGFFGIAVSCRGQSPALVKETGSKFGGNAGGGSAITQRFARFCRFGVGVATLNHEVLDHSVKQGAVVVACFDQPQKIISVERRGVGQAQDQYALGGREPDVALAVFFPKRGVGLGYKAQRADQEGECGGVSTD